MKYQEIKVHNIGGILSKTFLHNPLTPILGIFILIMGYFSLQMMPREENPQMVLSGGNIIVQLPGATPQEIANVIVKPIERKMKEVLGVEHIYGTAQNDVGMVTVFFYIGEDKEDSNLKMYDKMMQNMDVLPLGASQPIIKPLDIDTDIPIFSIAFYAKNKQVPQSDIYEKVKSIQHKLNSIENAAVTHIIGGHKKQFNIIVDANRLNRYALSMSDVQTALSSIVITNTQLKKSSGNEIKIVGIENVLEQLEDIQKIIINTQHGVVYLKDVATITESTDIQNYKEVEIGIKEDTLYSQVTLTVSKLKGSNSVIIADDIKAQLASMKEELNKEGIFYTVTRNDGERADDAVNELMFHLLISVIIIILLLVFVLGWKEAMIVMFTIPAIFSVTLFIAYLGDQTLNRITLFAFLLSLGLLVDDAIVVVENINRHFHLKSSQDKSNEEIMVEATDEIGASTNIATFAIILTMIPMAFVGQMMGEFMRPIPLNVPVAMFASLIIAYIFTPYLANKILKKSAHAKH
ncbi:MAG: efflux RND transporter permease subunit [Candidatus Marinarcus sp.]|uniref:efflux RND transporter permease subunit n=1 Tax=Candidatus Marinarcus sp. TaxID=3100987 RepID=UPI003B00C91D